MSYKHKSVVVFFKVKSLERKQILGLDALEKVGWSFNKFWSQLRGWKYLAIIMQTVNLAANNSNNSLCVTKTKVIRFIYKSTMQLPQDRTVKKCFQVSMGSLWTLYFFTVKKSQPFTSKSDIKTFQLFLVCLFFVCFFVCYFVCLFLRLFVSSFVCFLWLWLWE